MKGRLTMVGALFPVGLLIGLQTALSFIPDNVNQSCHLIPRSTGLGKFRSRMRSEAQ